MGALDNATESAFPTTMNRSYGSGFKVTDADQPGRVIKVTKLAGGKSLWPPTSNSRYGYYTQLKAHKSVIRAKETCAETQFVHKMHCDGIPYDASIRFYTHGSSS